MSYRTCFLTYQKRGCKFWRGGSGGGSPPAGKPFKSNNFSLERLYRLSIQKLSSSGWLAAQTACRRASWRPRRPPDGPPGAQDGLPTGLLAPKTASRRASWRPRQPPDGPPDAQDGLPTGLLAPKTAFRQASWHPRRPADGPPGAQGGLCTGLLAFA